MKKSLLLAALLAFGSLHAYADCPAPKAMVEIPDGNVAPVEDLVAAKKALAQYDADVKAYGTCLEEDTQKQIDALTPKATSATQNKAINIKNEAARKLNQEVDKLTAAAEKLNQQIRAFKARSSKG